MLAFRVLKHVWCGVIPFGVHYVVLLCLLVTLVID